jgi:TolA-binding protein
MTSDEVVERLARLAQDASGDKLTALENAGLPRLEHELARRRGRAHRAQVTRVLGWGLLAAALCAAATVLFLRERVLTFEVAHGKVGEGGYIVSESTVASVRFSDQSELGLEPGTRLRVSQLEVRGARMMLEGGLLHVHIRPRPAASWAIDAGPYVVHVTGTEFDLAWRADEQTLDLRLTRGSVTVEGPLANGGIRMQAGQHLVSKASDGSLSIVDERSAGAPQTDTPSTTTAAPGAETRLSSAIPAMPKVPSSVGSAGAEIAPAISGLRSVGSGWSARVAHGDFAGVLEGAERKGIDRTLAEASLPDLAAVADAARYERRQDVARRALLALRTRFTGSVQARDAAFFLGGLAESQDDGKSALEGYETYLRETPNGPYASQALGRRFMLVQRLQGPAAARPFAAEYVDRFRDGPYAPNARKLLQTQ